MATGNMAIPRIYPGRLEAGAPSFGALKDRNSVLKVHCDAASRRRRHIDRRSLNLVPDPVVKATGRHSSNSER